MVITHEEKYSWESKLVAFFLALLSTILTLYLLYGSYFGLQTALLERSNFYSLCGSAGLLMMSLAVKGSFKRLVLYAIALVTLVVGPYLNYNYDNLIMMGGIATHIDVVFFAVTLLGLLILVQFHIGWTMLILTLIALAYAFFGNYIPGRLGNIGFDLPRLTSHMLLTTNGLYGVPMGVAAQYIFLFSLLGTVMVKTGIGKVFVDLSYGITGRTQGGPGLAAVLSSALFGSINGSAVASAVTTGSFTIPLMKRTGYPAVVAAGIEAASASAGQILPPIMGAAAFLMAEITGIAYREIAIAAAVPAGLYVIALLVAVRLEAGKDRLHALTADEVPKILPVLATSGYLLLPLVILIAVLALGYTPMRAGGLAVLSGILISYVKKDTRLSFNDLINICVETTRISMVIIAAVAVAGVIIGILTLTGLALNVSSYIITLGGGHLFSVLVYTMIASFVLGMGMPTSAAYLLLAILVAPALVEMGVPTLSAHMFIFYYGLLSAITPPVALAAFAAAGIAQCDPNKAAFASIRLGFVKALVPFLFIYSPGVLLLASPANIAGDIIFSLIGVYAIAVGFSGWLRKDINWPHRLLWLIVGLAVVFPSQGVADLQVAYMVRLLAAAAIAALTINCLRARY